MQILNCVSELGTCCSDFGLAATLNIVRNILTMIQIVVPIILIVMSTVSLTKMVINPEEKNGMKKIYNQYLAAVFVFMLPVIIEEDTSSSSRFTRRVKSDNFPLDV